MEKTDKLRLNLYFDPIRRTHELFNLDILKKEQEISLTAIQKDKIPLDSDKSLEKWYSLYTLDYDKETRILHSFTLNETKLKEGKKQAGFFANITHGLDMTSIEANFHYRLRDEQEKYFTDMKSKLTFNRVCCWSEGGKEGREFILFVAQTLLSHLKYIHRTYLKNQFDSTIDILNEMRAIRYIAHPNTNPFITPFISKQLEIASAFGFEVPKGCGTEHTVRKTNGEKTGSTQKNKTAEK